MPWTSKVVGLNLTKTCFFFQTGNIVSNKVIGQLFVCLSVVGLVGTSWNRFFFRFNLVFWFCGKHSSAQVNWAYFLSA